MKKPKVYENIDKKDDHDAEFKNVLPVLALPINPQNDIQRNSQSTKTDSKKPKITKKTLIIAIVIGVLAVLVILLLILTIGNFYFKFSKLYYPDL